MWEKMIPTGRELGLAELINTDVSYLIVLSTYAIILVVMFVKK